MVVVPTVRSEPLREECVVVKPSQAPNRSFSSKASCLPDGACKCLFQFLSLYYSSKTLDDPQNFLMMLGQSSGLVWPMLDWRGGPPLESLCERGRHRAQ